MSKAPRYLVPLLLLLFWRGCAPGPVVVVSVSDLPPGAATLRMLVSLNGTEAQETPSFDLPGAAQMSSFRFGFRLPPDSAGAVVLAAGVVDQAGCLIRTGERTVKLEDVDPRVDVTLPLGLPPRMDCSGRTPLILKVTPVEVTADTEITIEGWGFRKGATVTVGDRTVPSEWLSPLRLKARGPRLPGTRGRLDVTVRDPDGQQDRQNRVLSYGLVPTFAATSIPLPSYPDSIASGDVNGDGKPDLVLSSTTLSGIGTVSVFLNQGEGRFLAAPLIYPVYRNGQPCAAKSVALGDMDGDKAQDLVVSDGKDGVIVLFQQGGGFPRDSQFGFSLGPVDRSDFIAVADLNGDGALDLAVVNDPFSTKVGGVTILINQRGGRDKLFVPQEILYPGTTLGFVRAGDLDGDGLPDLAANAISGNADGTVVRGAAIYINNHDPANKGTFGIDPVTAPVYYAVTSNALGSVVLADLNGDGLLDVAVSGLTVTSGAGHVAVLLNQRGGKFPQVSMNYPAGAYPFAMAAADLDGDGRPDLALTNGPKDLSQAGSLGVLFNEGADGFAYTQLSGYPIGRGSGALVAADLNGDGRPDLALAYQGNIKQPPFEPGSLTVLLNTLR